MTARKEGGVVTNLPDKSVVFDFDVAERPANQVKPPFVAMLAGRKITMQDPEELDWRDLILLKQPTEFLRIALSKEDKDFLLAQELPGWKFAQFLEAYYNHFDLDDKIAQAERRNALG